MSPRAKSVTLKPFVCTSCRSRRERLKPSHFRTFTTSPQHPASLSSGRYAQLTNRRVIRLAGPDATLFLHNLIPAKIVDIGGSTNPIYTAFLSAQGRILNDVFIYPPSNGSSGEEWFVEVDEAGAGDLLKHLKKHKLRAKFQLEKVDPEKTGVYYSWPSSEEHDGGHRIGGRDPRPGMGTRWLEDSSSNPVQQLRDSGSEQTTLEDYTIHRMRNGIAEGQSEIIPGHALPQESNIDFFGGIDFFKGCYLGQELTIRTHHTGVVRKRILPVQLYDKDTSPPPEQREAPQYEADSKILLPPAGSNISKMKAKGRGRSSGKWLGGVGNIGLALCRLEMMTDIQLTADCTNYDPAEQYKVQWEVEGEGPSNEVLLQPFVPAWLREGVEASLRRKEKKKPKHEEEDEEELD
ncbi:ccr4 associated factor [Cladophialophora chaetospira]|uniref:Iron-sulfur cluster assembly factor IBA57 homolog, mitochondrial n=1 Tax=Cladophialophora chaetospira TaxID=386627 RepID=A0AA39CC47_9EURO|nr:ccr4 associated factor [Cladophialophora chaetospira]